MLYSNTVRLNPDVGCLITHTRMVGWKEKRTSSHQAIPNDNI